MEKMVNTMKKIISVVILLPALVFSQSDDQNYVKSTTYTKEGSNVTDSRSGVTYHDGLGRPVQQVSGKASPNGKDIITYIEYDQYNRQAKQYLPFEAATDGLEYISGGKLLTEQFYYKPKYDNAPNPYSEQFFEASPLNRLAKQAAPGEAWLGKPNFDVTDHTIKYEYRANWQDNVRRFTVAFTDGLTDRPTLVSKGFYGNYQLYKAVVKDENWKPEDGKSKTTEEFKDKEGRIILRRKYTKVQSEADSSVFIDVPHDTYYVYDAFSNLTYVIPPMASDLIVQNLRVVFSAEPFTRLVKMDLSTAGNYQDRIALFPGQNPINVNLFDEYTIQGGLVLSAEDKNVSLDLNITSEHPVEFETGVLFDLNGLGDFPDSIIGTVSGISDDYVFSIRDNEVIVEGAGLISSIITTLSLPGSSTEKSYPWTKITALEDNKIAENYERDVASVGSFEMLNKYFTNPLGARGGFVIQESGNGELTLSVNISSDQEIELLTGKTILLDTQATLPDGIFGEVSGNGYHYTFSVLDNHLQILGSGSFRNLNFFGKGFIDLANIIDVNAEKMCYIYHYDRRNRIVRKHIPDNGWTHIVYDLLDRPALTQDEDMRNRSINDPVDNDNWLFTKYDIFGRIALTGSIRNDYHVSALQGWFDSHQEPLYEVRSSTPTVTEGMPIYYAHTTGYSYGRVLTANYYDDYNFDKGLAAAGLNEPEPTYEDFTQTTTGLPTGSIVRIPGTQNDDWVISFSKFDKKGREIYSWSRNTYLNTWNSVESKLDFLGKLMETKTTHRRAAENVRLVYDRFTYDNADRPLMHAQLIGNNYAGTWQVLSWNKYDELGSLLQKKVGGQYTSSPPLSYDAHNSLQAIDYTQNIRGWLTGLNNINANNSGKLFSFAIGYDGLYNGNISNTAWKSVTANDVRSYSYTYDALNRLTDAVYSDKIQNFDEKWIKYDKNGNMLNLSRWGLDQFGQYGKIDDLQYTYEQYSNRLLAVADYSTITKGFKDGNTTGNDYGYTASGNLIYDNNKGVTGPIDPVSQNGQIRYNYLNLPTKLQKDASNTIEYIYDAAGSKIAKKVTEGSITKVTAYAFGFVYEDNQLRYLSNAEGYAEPATNGKFSYIYQYKDHLNNVRLSYCDFNDDGIITDAQFFSDGFEQPGGWGNLHPGNTPVAYTLSKKHSGAMSAMLTVSNGVSAYCESDQWLEIDNAQATDYTYSGWVQSNGPIPQLTVYMKKALEVERYSDIDSNALQTLPADGSWVYMTKTITVPANIKKIKLRLDGLYNGNLYFDDVKLERVGGTEIVEESDYYPYGLQHIRQGAAVVSTNPGQKLKYNSMELQDEMGLDWYDYQARNYDPAIGRWFNIDRLADKSRRFSPYTYALDNPVYFMDPDGMEATSSEIDMTNVNVNSGMAINPGNGTVGYLSALGADIAGVKTSYFLDYGGGDKKKDNKAKNDKNSNEVKPSISKDDQGKPKSEEETRLVKQTNEKRAKLYGEKEKGEQDNNYNFFYKLKDNDLRIGADLFDDGGASASTIAVNAHGNESYIGTPYGKMYPKQLHEFLYNNNDIYKMSVDQGVAITVRIEACKTGLGFAREFSRYNSNMTVVAPTTQIISYSGFFNYLSNGGTYLNFKGGKKL